MQFPDKRYEGLNIPNLLSEETERKLSNIINCEIFDKLFISKRIGSESQFGTIWLCSMNKVNNEELHCSFIIKVQANRNKAQAEFEVQHYLSHTWSQHFLVTYGSIDCPEVTFHDKGKITKVKNGNFIFMETAIGDLAQVIQYSIVDEKMLTGYILDIIDAVEIMSLEKIFHGDLHIRQIFIVPRTLDNNCESSMKAVIGDFGEHIKIESPTMHLSDLRTFFKSLLEYIDYVENSERFRVKISQCLDYISGEIARIELDDDICYDSTSIERDITYIKSFFVL